MLDCPLRDAPFSVDMPLLDILLSPAAKAAVESEVPGMIAKIPERRFPTEPPSFAAIMTLRSMLGMRGTEAEKIGAVNAALAAVEVTDADRRARCARYDADLETLAIPAGDVRILVLDKINGFDHGPSVDAATAAVKSLADKRGWGVTVTGNGGAFTPELLSNFDAVVWNNVSGDVLTLSQRAAFEDYIENGGGYLGIHGSAGDSVYFWDWYADTLVGARFIGHPMQPQFQDADLHIESTPSGIGAELPSQWSMHDEWYSFAQSPRASGAAVVATLDESTYEPGSLMGQDLRMGEDHPVVWTRCVGDGRSFYSAVGHRPEVYRDARYMKLLGEGLAWAAGQGRASCAAAQ